MTNKIIIFALIAILSVSCSQKEKQTDANSSKPATSSTELPVIAGSWKSIEPEFAGNGQYAVKEYNINLSRWELNYSVFADKLLKKPIYVYHAEGSYIIENTSSKVKGAYNLLLKNSKKSITLKSKDKLTIQDLGFADCKLSAGKEKDITDQGCSFFKSNDECQQEFDLVKVENSRLRFGERPTDNDLCVVDHRPEALGPELKKIN